MSGMKVIKAKIKSVKNLKKITKALEIVSTVKLQKVKDSTDKLKSYFIDLLFIIETVWDKANIFSPDRVYSNKSLYILVSTDRWLCWSLNSKLFKKFLDDVENTDKSNIDVFVIGKKWLEFVLRSGFNVVWQLNLSDNFTEEEMIPLFTFLENALENAQYKDVKIYFNFFKNTLVQYPVSLDIYPLEKKNIYDFFKQVNLDYSFSSNIGNKSLIVEPDEETLIKEIKRQIRNYLIMGVVLQNKAWEHASRMIAMKNATDNSQSMIKKLTLSFNKARQAAITQEISEIVSAKMAMES